MSRLSPRAPGREALIASAIWTTVASTDPCSTSWWCAAIGGDIAARYGVNPTVCNAIAAHHQEVEQESTEATVVQIADAISASRPGARGESLDNYVKRLDDLQQIALSFPGVERCFAIQAGREIRILVRPEDIDDLASSRLARDVVRKIEEQLQYPGQIKVTVIRETRAVDYAR